MAGETLLTAADTLAGFPDNTQGLITPLDSRNFVVSAQTSSGFIEEQNDPVTLTMVDGVWVSVLSALLSPDFVGLYWKLDGNQQFIPAYADEGITVNVGTIRLVRITVIALTSKVAAGAPSAYSARTTLGGVQVGTVGELERDTTKTASVAIRDFTSDISLDDPIDVQIRPDGHSDDLIVQEATVSLGCIQI